jgi:hypothetical protein
LNPFAKLRASFEPPKGVERLERLEERLECLERLEPDFKTGHSKIQNLLLEVTLEAAISIRDILAPITSTKR